MPIWRDFFTTAAEVAGTLSGLIMVALSVNIQRILQVKHLPSRAFAAITSLLLVLVTGMAALIPDQRMAAFGAEVLAVSLVGWFSALWAARQSLDWSSSQRRSKAQTALGIVLGQAATLPFVVGAGFILGGLRDGLDWIAGGVVFGFILSVLNAWVLLVEILR